MIQEIRLLPHNLTATNFFEHLVCIMRDAGGSTKIFFNPFLPALNFNLSPLITEALPCYALSDNCLIIAS